MSILIHVPPFSTASNGNAHNVPIPHIHIQLVVRKRHRYFYDTFPLIFLICQTQFSFLFLYVHMHKSTRVILVCKSLWCISVFSDTKRMFDCICDSRYDQKT